jgi:hypothetical protein
MAAKKTSKAKKAAKAPAKKAAAKGASAKTVKAKSVKDEKNLRLTSTAASLTVNDEISRLVDRLVPGFARVLTYQSTNLLIHFA